MIVTCECGQKLSVPPELAGKHGRCPHCKRMIPIPASEAQVQHVLKVKCPCGQILSVPAQLAGKQGRCPHCKTVITIPARDMNHVPRSPQSESAVISQGSPDKRPSLLSVAEENSKRQSEQAAPQKERGWVLNPDTTFPLTLLGVDEATGAEVKRILQALGQSDLRSSTRDLAAIIAGMNIRCKEVEDYVAWARKQCLTKVEELKKRCAEWSTSSETEREELLEDFRGEAMSSLDITPFCDLPALLEGEGSDTTDPEEVASLVVHTYMAARPISDWRSMGDDPFLVGWELSAVGDDSTCPYCERASKKKYSKNDCPKTPLHIGCRCMAVAKQKFA